MKVLIQCGDHFENQQRISTLAHLLKSGGHTPVVLMYNSHKGGLFKEIGVDVVYLDQYLKQYDGDSNAKNASSWLDVGVQYRDILDVEASRRPNIAWPKQIQSTLNNIYRHYYALMNILLGVQPDRIVIWNGQTGFVANCLRIISEKKYKVPTAFLERGLIKDSLFIDYRGVNGGSSLTFSKITPKELTQEDLGKVTQYFKVNYAMLNQCIILNKKNIKSVFFPLQVQRDTNILFYSPYTSMRQVFQEFSAHLNNDVKKTIRPHPEEDPKEVINIAQSEHTHISSKGGLDECISQADLIVTVNSTVGLEALVEGKPVVTLGDSIYSNAGITFNLNHLKSNVIKEIPYNYVLSYLHFLMSNNLLFGENAYNKQIVEKNLALSLIGGVDNSKHAKKPIMVDKVQLLLNFNPIDRLDLTYRKNSEEITLDWIKKCLAAKFEFNMLELVEKSEKFEQHKSIVKVVMISDVKKASFECECDFVLDIYGNVLKVRNEDYR